MWDMSGKIANDHGQPRWSGIKHSGWGGNIIHTYQTIAGSFSGWAACQDGFHPNIHDCWIKRKKTVGASSIWSTEQLKVWQIWRVVLLLLHCCFAGRTSTFFFFFFKSKLHINLKLHVSRFRFNQMSSGRGVKTLEGSYTFPTFRHCFVVCFFALHSTACYRDQT